MHPLYHILYRTHASSTHQKLALAALGRLACSDAQLWRRLFLEHAALYLEGAEAPDRDFKDFKNHVLYPREGYWGGAPRKVVSWYQHLLEALGQEDWPTAVYCAGVLSHYYTDPLHPFHTAQSETENNIHRAVECSIAQSYEALSAQAEREFKNSSVVLASGPHWLASLVCAGAERANAQLEKLIAHYDLQRGVVEPRAGLDPIARRILAELISYATASFALVLGRAIAEAGVTPPRLPLGRAVLRASLRAPLGVYLRRRAAAAARRQLEKSYDELMAAGKVEASLGEAERSVRDLFAEEVLARRKPAAPSSQIFAFAPRPRVITRIEASRAARASTPPPLDNVVAFAGAQRPRAGLTLRLAQVRPPPPRRPARSAAAAADSGKLALDDEVAKSPSIGARTAARLGQHGIKTVRDLIRADPIALSVLIAHRRISSAMISAWQDQARLACTLPGLGTTPVQLLVGAGYLSASEIAAAEPEKLYADVLQFAATPPGQRLIGEAGTPDREKIMGWCAAARSIEAA